MVICVDFDGTVVKHEFPKVGDDVSGAVETLQKIVADGHKLVLFTMRSGKTLDDAVNWYKSKGIPLYGIQINPTQQNWTKSPKAYGQLYIDDAAYGCPLIQDYDEAGKKKGRPYVDWKMVYSTVKILAEQD